MSNKDIDQYVTCHGCASTVPYSTVKILENRDWNDSIFCKDCRDLYEKTQKEIQNNKKDPLRGSFDSLFD